MPVKRVLSLNSIDYVSNKNDDSGFTSKRCRKNKNLDKKQINSQSRSQPQNFATTSVNTNPVIPVIDVKNNELMSNESSNAAVISTLCEKIKGLEQIVQLLRDQVGFLLSFVGAVGVPLSSDRQLILLVLSLKAILPLLILLLEVLLHLLHLKCLIRQLI